MEKERRVIASWKICPDGTMLPSFHVHDYRSHTTVDTYKRKFVWWRRLLAKIWFVQDLHDWLSDFELVPDKIRITSIDGGVDYNRGSIVGIDIPVYEDDHFEVIRRFFCRGGRGVDGSEPLTYVPLFKMSNSWLEATIRYTPNNYYNKFYQQELDYRKNNNIFIED